MDLPKSLIGSYVVNQYTYNLHEQQYHTNWKYLLVLLNPKLPQNLLSNSSWSYNLFEVQHKRKMANVHNLVMYCIPLFQLNRNYGSYQVKMERSINCYITILQVSEYIDSGEHMPQISYEFAFVWDTKLMFLWILYLTISNYIYSNNSSCVFLNSKHCTLYVHTSSWRAFL